MFPISAKQEFHLKDFAIHTCKKPFVIYIYGSIKVTFFVGRVIDKIIKLLCPIPNIFKYKVCKMTC